MKTYIKYHDKENIIKFVQYLSLIPSQCSVCEPIKSIFRKSEIICAVQCNTFKSEQKCTR